MKKSLIVLLVTMWAGTVASQAPPIGSGSSIPYENRSDIMNAPDCNPSEAYIKNKVKAHVATQFEDYPHIWVDVTSFKAKKGDNHKTFPDQIVYPYKIEMVVYIKRKLMKEGKEFTEE